METRTITTESQTTAIKASRVLYSNGIKAKTVRLRQGQSPRGCTHGVRVSVHDLDRACNILYSAGIYYSGIIS